jgi:hypothetical protein
VSHAATPERIDQLDVEVDRERCYVRACAKTPVWLYRVRLPDDTYWPGCNVRDLAACSDPQHARKARQAGQVLSVSRWSPP